MRLKQRSMREHTARGTIVNAGFSVALTTLALLKGVVVAAFLTPSEYGIWGVLMITLMTVVWLKQAGIGDKFIQQREHDQERAFRKAFTLELIFNSVLVGVFLAAIPVFLFVYGRTELVAPGLLMALALPVAAFQAPTWVYYREMDFLRQRTLQAVDPVVGFVVTIVLAVTGAGYWSLVVGVLVGALAGSMAAVLASPYRLGLTYEPGTARDYVRFSWPLVLAGGSSLAIAQASIIVGEAELGLAGAGAIALAATIADYSNRVDGIVTATLYPAICAVRERTDLLYESFVKSNRLALMWGVPFGLGLTLFASDLIRFALGEDWRHAELLLQVFGTAAAVGHIAFNWDAFYRARGETRPVAVWSALTMLSFMVVALPLLVTDGLEGFAIGIAVMTAVSLAIRCYYLVRLFSQLSVLTHALRAVAPVVPAVAAVLALRALEGDGRGAGLVLAELSLFLGVSVVATLWLEQALLREVVGYLRGARGSRPRAAV